MISAKFPRPMPRAGVARYAFFSMKIILIFMLLFAGCSKMPTLQPHKIDIQQGNFVTQDMVAKLKPGMTRSQVRFALGTPLIVDPFRTDRWDYVYLMRKGGDLVEQRNVTVVFKGDLLDRIEGDVVAGAKSSPAGAPKPPVVQESK